MIAGLLPSEELISTDVHDSITWAFVIKRPGATMKLVPEDPFATGELRDAYRARNSARNLCNFVTKVPGVHLSAPSGLRCAI